MCMNSRSKPNWFVSAKTFWLFSNWRVPYCVQFLLCLLLWKFVPRLRKCRTTTRIKPCQTSSVQNGVFGVKLCWWRLEKANTSKPGGRIPIYKPYGCVPLILKGKCFSVPLVHLYPAPHRVPPTSHPWGHPPCPVYTRAVLSGLQHQPDDVSWRHSIKNWKLLKT